MVWQTVVTRDRPSRSTAERHLLVLNTFYWHLMISSTWLLIIHRFMSSPSSTNLSFINITFKTRLVTRGCVCVLWCMCLLITTTILLLIRAFNMYMFYYLLIKWDTVKYNNYENHCWLNTPSWVVAGDPVSMCDDSRVGRHCPRLPSLNSVWVSLSYNRSFSSRVDVYPNDARRRPAGVP